MSEPQPRCSGEDRGARRRRLSRAVETPGTTPDTLQDFFTVTGLIICTVIACLGGRLHL